MKTVCKNFTIKVFNSKKLVNDMEQVKRKNLDYIDYFRAIAIIFIVAGHTLVWGMLTIFEFNISLFKSNRYKKYKNIYRSVI